MNRTTLANAKLKKGQVFVTDPDSKFARCSYIFVRKQAGVIIATDYYQRHQVFAGFDMNAEVEVTEEIVR